MRLQRAARVILIGAPGVGKGTQSERLLQRFPQLSSISSGDLLRHNVKQRTPLGIKVESTLKTGGLVPDDLILRLITNELNHRGWLFANATGRPNTMTLSSSAIGADEASSYERDADVASFISSPTMGHNFVSSPSEDPSASFLLDGFPRTAAQADRLDEIVPINLAVGIHTPLDVIMERISGRWVHEPSGRVYNTTFNAPKVPGLDDITGEKLVRRADDSEEVYRQRFKKFQETSEPLMEHYARKGVLIEVEGMSSDEISPKLYQEFEERFC
ncbi:P-loop containing nucleoside triphosphate hydrolase protein [Thozetella sp. PMI_491]|nr:P-loop containing nucleoside triphosphate hydrolase protein [Thozetella sp. PMI_491]